MVLILLSTPTSNSFWPATPKTPLTPSPSFFAILSPIFTADDAAPASPAGLMQVSPGMIAPNTPPPWQLGTQLPTTPVRATLSRTNSYYERPTISRISTTDSLRPASSRPAFPSTTYSFTAGHAQAFRPPPALALKRTRTEPVYQAPRSPLRQALGNASKPLPRLTIRPPSREEPTAVAPELESEMLPIALDIASPVDSECMEIPIAFEAASNCALNWTQAIKDTAQSLPGLANTKSSSLYNPLELTAVQTPRLSVSVANLKQHDLEVR